jgi:hypothetical protein
MHVQEHHHGRGMMALSSSAVSTRSTDADGASRVVIRCMTFLDDHFILHTARIRQAADLPDRRPHMPPFRWQRPTPPALTGAASLRVNSAICLPTIVQVLQRTELPQSHRHQLPPRAASAVSVV